MGRWVFLLVAIGLMYWLVPDPVQWLFHLLVNRPYPPHPPSLNPVGPAYIQRSPKGLYVGVYVFLVAVTYAALITAHVVLQRVRGAHAASRKPSGRRGEA